MGVWSWRMAYCKKSHFACARTTSSVPLKLKELLLFLRIPYPAPWFAVPFLLAFLFAKKSLQEARAFFWQKPAAVAWRSRKGISFCALFNTQAEVVHLHVYQSQVNSAFPMVDFDLPNL